MTTETHAQFCERLEAIRKQNQIQYRGYVIEPSTGYMGGYEYWPTAEGYNPDYDWDGDGWRNCGNVQWASDLDEAKDEIFEKIMCAQPQHLVVMNRRPYYFDWISDAIKFAILWNAEEFHPALTA